MPKFPENFLKRVAEFMQNLQRGELALQQFPDSPFELLSVSFRPCGDENRILASDSPDCFGPACFVQGL